MIYRNFGNTNLKVSALGFGAGEIGDYAVSEKDSEKILNTVLDLGINLIDFNVFLCIQEKVKEHQYN